MKNSFAKAAIYAGLIAGLIFLMLELIMVPLFGGGSAWGPPAMIAAMVLGPDILPAAGEMPSFSMTNMLVAAVVHFPLAIIYTMVIGMVVKRVGNGGMALLIGAAGGLAIYYINFYGFTAIFPWFAMARGWISIFAHVVFGISAAIAFNRFYHHHHQHVGPAQHA